jgi:hypothetical protein
MVANMVDGGDMTAWFDEKTNNFASAHLDALRDAPPSSRESVLAVRCSAAYSASNESVTRFASAYPNLEDVVFDTGCSLDDTVIVAIIKNCPNIRRICNSGDDRSHGKVKAQGFLETLSQPGAARKLRHLELMDQYPHAASVKKISKMRPEVAIVEGETEGDSTAAQYVASITGGGHETVWLYGKMVGNGMSLNRFGGGRFFEGYGFDDDMDEYGW